MKMCFKALDANTDHKIFEFYNYENQMSYQFGILTLNMRSFVRQILITIIIIRHSF